MQTMLVVKTNVGLAPFDVPGASYISEYENGVRRPSLLVGLAYSRLGKIPMDLLVDDHVSLDAFRGELGTDDYKQLETGSKNATPSKSTQPRNAVTGDRRKKDRK